MGRFLPRSWNRSEHLSLSFRYGENSGDSMHAEAHFRTSWHYQMLPFNPFVSKERLKRKDFPEETRPPWAHPRKRLVGKLTHLPGEQTLCSSVLKERSRSVGVGRGRCRIQVRVFISAVRTAWPATRPAHSFFKFRAYTLNVLPSGFRFLDGDNPADPLIAR